MPKGRREPKKTVSLPNLGVARVLCGARKVRSPAERRAESARDAAAAFGISHTQFLKWESGDDDMGVSDLRRATTIFGLSADFLIGLPCAQRLNPAYLPHIQAFLDTYRSRDVAPTLTVKTVVEFFNARDPSLFSPELFKRRLGLDDADFISYMRGQQADGYVADDIQELLRIPNVWVMSGDAADLPAAVLTDGDLLLMRFEAAGVSKEDLMRYQADIIQLVEKKKAGR